MMDLGDAYVDIAGFLNEAEWIALMLTHSLPRAVASVVMPMMDARWFAPGAFRSVQEVRERAGQFIEEMHEVGVVVFECDCHRCERNRKKKRKAARRQRRRQRKAARRLRERQRRQR